MAKITRKFARGTDRSGSAKRPHFRFVRQSVSCGRHARGGNPFLYFWVAAGGQRATMPRATTRAPGLCLKISLELSFPFRPPSLHPPLFTPRVSSHPHILGSLSLCLPPLTAEHVWLLFLWILRKSLPWVRLCLTLLRSKKNDGARKKLIGLLSG